MLNVRQRGLMSAIWSFVMGLIIVVFVIEFRPNAHGPITSIFPTCAAKVRGSCVDEKQWKAYRYLLLRGAQEQVPEVNWNKAALDALVERTLLEQEAARLGIRATAEDVTQEIVKWHVYLHLPLSLRPHFRELRVDPFGSFRPEMFGSKDKAFDQQMFERFVTQTTGQLVNEFEEEQRRELVAARMLQIVASRVHIGEFEAWDAYSRAQRARSVFFLRQGATYFQDRFLPTDAATVEAWASNHATEVKAREDSLPKEQERRALRARRIVLSVPTDASAEKRAEVHKKADELLEKLKSGEDFARLARDESTESATKYRGAEFGWSAGYDWPDTLREAVAKLKVLEYAIVDVPDGVQIVQLVGRLDGAAAVALPLYLEARGQELAKAFINKVIELAKPALPVAFDDALNAKVEEAKKAGKTEEQARSQVRIEATRDRLEKAIADALATMTPVPLPGADKVAAGEDKKADKGAEAPKVLPIWQVDERRPRLDESGRLRQGQPPIGSIANPKLADAAWALSAQAPLSEVFVEGSDVVLLAFRDEFVPTKEDFARDKPTFVENLLSMRRFDAVTLYLQGLRDAAAKDIKVEARYVADEKKSAPGQSAPPVPVEE